MKDDMVEVRFRVRRRTAAIAGAIAAVLAVLAAWWVVSGTAAVGLGSASSTGVGHADRCTYPDGDFWAVYARDETPVAVQTIRNDSLWQVEVISQRSEAFRFGPLASDPRDDVVFPDPSEGPPPDGHTTDRVVIPPGREVALWIIDPFPPVGGQWFEGQVGYDQRVGIDGAEVRVRSLGIARDSRISFDHVLWSSELSSDSQQFQRELVELCES